MRLGTYYTIKDRIRTGSVINLKHKEIKYFLDGLKSMIVLRLRNVLKRDGNSKVYLTSDEKFEALEQGKMIQDVVHFQTENNIILESRDSTYINSPKYI